MTDQPPAFYFRSLANLWDRLEPQLRPHSHGVSNPYGGVLPGAVMFIDMTGFSGSVFDLRDQPQAAAFIAHHFVTLIENHSAVGRRAQEAMANTYIDKVIGDELMLVLPGERDVALQRAFGFVELLSFFPYYPKKIGLHWSNRLWVGDIGLPMRGNRHERFCQITVMGYAVQVAARLTGAKLPLSAETDLRMLQEGGPITGVCIPERFAAPIEHDVELAGVAEGSRISRWMIPPIEQSTDQFTPQMLVRKWLEDNPSQVEFSLDWD